jgi:hypothetical protein
MVASRASDMIAKLGSGPDRVCTPAHTPQLGRPIPRGAESRKISSKLKALELAQARQREIRKWRRGRG